MRLDKYLKVSRLIKRRTVANEACDNARISVNGKSAKASYDVKVGDQIEIAFGARTLRVEVLAVAEAVRKDGVSAVINSDTKAITIILPYGTDLKHVAPTIVTANASKVEPSSAQRVDLSTPKAYRVYASNGAYVTYTVTAYTEEPSPTQSLWEKLQNQINSNPNWWELAEYQKKTGYYK